MLNVMFHLHTPSLCGLSHCNPAHTIQASVNKLCSSTLIKNAQASLPHNVLVGMIISCRQVNKPTSAKQLMGSWMQESQGSLHVRS